MRSMDDLLTIGRFARLAGLSVGALRHYDELDLLRPARTDPFTSYRLYGRGQLETARLIVRLRDLEVPLDTIRAVPRRRRPGRTPAADARAPRPDRGPDVPAPARPAHPRPAQLGGHRLAMTATDPPPRPSSTRRPVATLAADLFNHTWTLLEKPDRTPERGRRDDPQRPRLALPLGRGRRPATRSTSPAASGSAHGSTRSSAGRSRPCGMRAGAWPSTRRPARSTGTSPRRTRRWPGPTSWRATPPRSPPGRQGQRRPWTGSPTGTIAS